MSAKVNISEAGRMFGKDRKTIHDVIAKHSISTEKTKSGTLVQLVDLIAVYGEPKNKPTGNGGVVTPQETTPPHTLYLQEKIELLEKRNWELEEDREERKEREGRLENDRERLQKQVERLLLPKPEEAQPPPQQKPKSLSWQSVTLIGCGIVMTIALVFVAWVLPHLG